MIQSFADVCLQEVHGSSLDKSRKAAMGYRGLGQITMFPQTRVTRNHFQG